MIELALPFRGPWRAENSPARRVPSHGTDLFATRYAIDFVGVTADHRTSQIRDWRTFLSTEPPDRFVAFGSPILSPVAGTVVTTLDTEPDHEARRSQLTLIPYALTQASRARGGWRTLAGNYVIIAVPGTDTYVALAHLQTGSVRVTPGQRIETGEPVALCGNSGNSTQPHVHIQAMTAPNATQAEGVPMEFRDFHEWARGAKRPETRARGMPAERAVVAPIEPG